MSIATALAALTALFAFVAGGELLVWSGFVMPGLRRLPAPAAIAAMQAMNAQAPRSTLLLVPLIGGALTGAALIVAALVIQEPGWVLQLAGGACYLVSFVITPAYHIPRNNALDRYDANDPAAAAYWEQQYYPQWVPMNTVRSLLGIAAGVVLTVSLVQTL